MISSKWLDFTGTGEACCSIVGSCSYGGAYEKLVTLEKFAVPL